MKKYDERTCLYQLNRKHDCRISGKVIQVNKDNGDVGQKSWRKIEYLCKVHGYRYMITSFSNVQFTPKKKYNEDYDTKKSINKKGKLNLHKMVKNIMTN